jgi:hypothetical protein
MAGVGVAWVAGSTRGRLLADRRLGRIGARNLAASASLQTALITLEDGPYGHDVHRGMTLAEAQRAADATALWHIRVLAGWLPPRGGDLLRLLAGWWEIQNVDDLLATLSGIERPRPLDLGSLTTIWPQVADAGSPSQLREALTASPWGDPGGDTSARIGMGLRLSWARRVAEQVDDASAWAGGLSALVIARDMFTGERFLLEPDRPRIRELGRRWSETDSPAELRASLPASAAWVLDGVSEVEELWRAEARWWSRVESDSLNTLRAFRPGPAMVVAVFGLLWVDAWRVQAALELAARGGRPMEVFDTVA